MNNKVLVAAFIAGLAGGVLAAGLLSVLVNRNGAGNAVVPPPAESAAIAGKPAQTPDSGARSDDSAKAFGEKVRAYLLRSPEVLAEAIGVLQTRQYQAGLEQQRKMIRENASVLRHDADSAVGGNPDGDVTVVEFFDYNCPYCKRIHPVLKQLLAEDKGVRFVYKDFPVLGPNSVLAARAALAARRQKKYEAFHDALLERPAKLTEEAIWQAASKVGLDVVRLQNDMRDPAISQAIDRNISLGQVLRITGTPTIVIGETLIPGAVDRPVLDLVIQHTRAGDPPLDPRNLGRLNQTRER